MHVKDIKYRITNTVPYKGIVWYFAYKNLPDSFRWYKHSCFIETHQQIPSEIGWDDYGSDEYQEKIQCILIANSEFN